jgi:hypothetical protein
MDFELEEAIAILERTPRVLQLWVGGLSEDWITAKEGEDSWSPFDVLGHLIHGERTDWIPRVKIILSGTGTRKFEPFDRFAMFEESQTKTVQDLLDTFKTLRQDSINHLRSMQIAEKDYGETGEHPDLGVVTLKQLLATWVVHDLDHLGQIAEVMARQYTEEVGPWKSYLDILGP